MKRLLTVLTALAIGCAHREASPPSKDATVSATAGDDETALDDAWLSGAPAESDVVTRVEAMRFVDATFALVERHLYDPGLVEAHGRAAREAAARSITAKESPSRQDTIDSMNQALQAYGVSHLGIATPTKLRARFGLGEGAATSTAERHEAVSAEVRGDVGIVRIESFLVPEIRHDLVRRAFDRLRDARVLVVDLRGNGGGSASSVVYTAQYLVGPDVLAEIVQTRRGHERRVPHDMRGFFADAENAGSTADLALGKREGFVRWWTPPDAPPAPRRPTYLLVDEHCASSCEVFAAMMVDAGAATIVGRKTPGEVLAAQGVKTSWKGYLLFVPFGTVLSPKGRVIEGVGVQPKVSLDVCAEGHDPAACLAAAIEVARRPTAKP